MIGKSPAQVVDEVITVMREVSGLSDSIRINVFDQDTLNHLQAQGVSRELLIRVRHVMEDSARAYRLIGDPREAERKVVWVIDSADEAAAVNDLVGHNGLLTAINRYRRFSSGV